MKKTAAPKSRAKKHAELKKRAFKRHPGVKEVMEVYNQWTEAHQAELAFQAAQNAGRKVTYSSSSDPESFL